MKSIGLILATAGGAGYAKFAPGTVGAAVGVALYFVIQRFGHTAETIAIVVVSAVGVWAANVAARHFDKEDPGYVVIDEVAGQLVTLAWFDVGLMGAAIGFLLFRIFDIVKPWPAGRFEALPGGWGIMADDLMAGVYGWLVLWGVLAMLPALR